MYRTIKVRIKMSDVEKQYVEAYEAIFKEEIKHCIIQMQECPLDIRYKTMQFSNFINKSNYWIIYKLALHMHRCISVGRSCHYGRSSSWSPKAIQMGMNHMILLYGEDFPIKWSTLTLMPLTDEFVEIKTNKLIRVDLIHKDNLWYANFLIQIQENNKIK